MVQVSLRGLLLAVILSCCLVLLGDVALQLLLQFWEAIEPYIRWYAYFSVAYAIVGSLISLFLVRKPKVLHAIPYLIVDPAVCGECKECRRSGGAYCERHPFRTGKLQKFTSANVILSRMYGNYLCSVIRKAYVIAYNRIYLSVILV